MNYYTSLRELPIKNYIEILNTGNLAWLFKFKENGVDTKRTVNEIPKEYPDEFNEVWEEINYQHDVIELDKNTIDCLKALGLRDLYIHTDKSVYLTRARELEKRIENRIKNSKKEKISLGDLVTDIEVYFKEEIDEYTYSSQRFFRRLRKVKNDKTKQNGVIGKSEARK